MKTYKQLSENVQFVKKNAIENKIKYKQLPGMWRCRWIVQVFEV